MHTSQNGLNPHCKNFQNRFNMLNISKVMIVTNTALEITAHLLISTLNEKLFGCEFLIREEEYTNLFFSRLLNPVLLLNNKYI